MGLTSHPLLCLRIVHTTEVDFETGTEVEIERAVDHYYYRYLGIANILSNLTLTWSSSDSSDESGRTVVREMAIHGWEGEEGNVIEVG